MPRVVDPTLYGPPASTLEILLDDPAEHDIPAPERVLAGLTSEQAVMVPPGLPYSVARIVAHMNSNMMFNLGLIRAANPLTYDEELEDWPAVGAADWPRLVAQFLSNLAHLKQLARQQDLERVLYPAADGEAAWTVGYKLALSVAKHNAYHLGQIIVIRRLLGFWDG